MQKKNANKNATLKKMRTKMQKKCKLHVFRFFFAFFGGGFVWDSIFSKFAKNLGKMQKTAKIMQKKKRKKCKTNATKNANCICSFFFCIFWKGVLSGLHIFSKIAKNLGKMQKTCKQNAKKKQTKMRKKCKFWKCACFTKTNLQKLHCFLHFCLHFCLHFFCIFLGQGF